MKYFVTIVTFILLSVLVSTSLALVNWEKHLENPVFYDSTVTWTIGGAFGPCVVFDGTTYHMWYSGYDGINVRIGYATSPDGFIWEPYINNPVLDLGLPGSWDEAWVYYPFVIYDGLSFHMWYSGVEGDVVNWKSWAERIGYATSPDGITWTKYANNPVLDLGISGSWDDYNVADCSLFYDGIIYHLWYIGGDGLSSMRIGYATSPDGTSWTKYAQNPVLDIGSWDYPRVQHPRVIFDGSKYHMLYSGGGLFTWRIGYASSDDGKNWIKYANNPILDVGASGSWDDQYVGAPSLLFDKANSKYRMWYAGGNASWEGSIGYATAPPTVIYYELSNDLPKNFVLRQNYPNPFNPSTTIELSIPKSEYVTLKIYNLLGQEVATRVSEKLNAGSYTFSWNAGSLASGVYYYRIKAGEFQDMKKMILLR